MESATNLPGRHRPDRTSRTGGPRRLGWKLAGDGAGLIDLDHGGQLLTVYELRRCRSPATGSHRQKQRPTGTPTAHATARCRRDQPLCASAKRSPEAEDHDDPAWRCPTPSSRNLCRTAQRFRCLSVGGASGAGERWQIAWGAVLVGLIIGTPSLANKRHDPLGRVYYQKKIDAEKGKKGSLRCLQRRLPDVVFRTLVEDQAGRNPGGQMGATLTSSAADLIPMANTSAKPQSGSRTDPTTAAAF